LASIARIGSLSNYDDVGNEKTVIKPVHLRKSPAKRTQHFNTTYPNTVSPEFACSGQTIPTLRAFGHPVTTCCDMLFIENQTCALARSNSVARTCPNDYNIMQHPQMMLEKFDHFQI